MCCPHMCIKMEIKIEKTERGGGEKKGGPNSSVCLDSDTKKKCPNLVKRPGAAGRNIVAGNPNPENKRT